MTELIRFSFALGSRTLSFIQVRDALACLDEAHSNLQPFLWLHAATDLRTSLIGDLGRKAAIPEIIGLLENARGYLQNLAKDLPQYRESIDATCADLSHHIGALQSGLSEAITLLERDALLNIYYNTQKKQDWLGHRPCLPQSLKAIWSNSAGRTEALFASLAPLRLAIRCLDDMFHDFVTWERRVAQAGSDQIAQNREQCFGLLIIGLTPEDVADGLIPDISGNRLAIRVRFQRWHTGMPPEEVTSDQPYSAMLVPIA